MAGSAAGTPWRVDGTDTPHPSDIAGPRLGGHTDAMTGFKSRRRYYAAVLTAVVFAASLRARADEIRLKDGKKLYGVIVAYEDNMFKVKTDFGYVLVEKDKIESIIPSTPAGETPKTEKSSAAKRDQPADAQPKAQPAIASASAPAATAVPASAKTAAPAPVKPEKPAPTAPKINSAAAKPEIPPNNAKSAAVAPSISAPAVPASGVAASLAQPAAPEPPPIRENIQGNLYTNYTHGFQMYKAPSWELLEDARQGVPNAIVALGSYNRQTLLVIGEEETKEPLDAAARSIEKRLSEIYENYQRISQKKTTVGGLPAMEYHYRGKADDHDWSGTLVVIARGTDAFTALGMTYADNDLIQIQENVIARSIASLDFKVH